MPGYMESKYYERLDRLIESGEIHSEAGQEKALQYLEEELNWPNRGGEWLAYHYDSAASYLWDNCMTEKDEGFDQYVALAKKEIKIFAKAGFDGTAKFMERALNDVLSGRRAKDWE